MEILDDTGSAVSGLPDLGQNASNGTVVAGLIAAENNGVGTVGVAYNSNIAGVNIMSSIIYGFIDYSTLAGQTEFLHVVEQASNFDVMVNPWDNATLFNAEQNQLNDDSFANLYVQQVAQNLSEGRGELGSVVVQSAGDDGSDANGSGVNASRYTTTVAVTDMNGNATASANFGSSILVVASVATYTTDLLGNDGLNATGTNEPSGGDPLPDIDYTSTFGGSASATAIAAGIIALMMEANPNLGWRDIQNILALSASDTGSNIGAGAVGFEQGAWAINGADNWNGGGLSVNGSYGYGMIDAFAAVRMAEAWGIIHGIPLTSTNEQEGMSTFVDFDVGMDIPENGDEISFELITTDELSIEHIQLNLGFSHTFVGDVEVF